MADKMEMKKWKKAQREGGLLYRSYNISVDVLDDLDRISKKTKVNKSRIVDKALGVYLRKYDQGQVNISKETPDSKLKELALKTKNFMIAYFQFRFEQDEIKDIFRILNDEYCDSKDDLNSKKFYNRINPKIYLKLHSKHFDSIPDNSADDSESYQFNSYEEYLSFNEAFHKDGAWKIDK